jgi:hypothetical protein
MISSQSGNGMGIGRGFFHFSEEMGGELSAGVR